jgi:4-carboxymuconolactone decarboxylase
MTTLLPPPDANAPELAAVLAEIQGSRGIVSNVMHALTHAPEGLRRFAWLGDYARYGSSLSERVRELVILLTGRSVPYAWAHHAPIGRQAGLSDAELAAIRAGEIPETFTTADAALARFTLALGPGKPVPEALFAELRLHFSPRQITDVVLIAAFFTMTATIIGAMEVELEEGHVLQAEQARQRDRDAGP